MRLTRIAIVVLLVSLLAFPLVAADNHQKIYSLDEDVYSAIQLLYIAQGLSLPSTTGPYSEAELSLMLEKIDRASLRQSLAPTYDYVVAMLGLEPKIQGKGIGMNWNVDLSLETYLHKDTTNFVGRENWRRGWLDQKPLVNIGLETWPAKNLYGYSEFSIGNSNTLNNGFGKTLFQTNLPFLPPADKGDLDFNMPYRAFVAAGGDHWTFQLGRDRLNWGAGTTGNLMLSDTFKYHNMARMTTFSDKFKYTFVASFFPHPKQYFEQLTSNSPGSITLDPAADPIDGDSQEALLDGIYMFMSHRLEWRMFKDKVGLTLTESIMYQSEENLLDLRIFNPAMIFHDYYIRSNANSILGLEVDYTPIPGLNIYAQAAVDEFSLPGEDKPSKGQTNYPETFGFLGGVKGVFPVNGLVGYASLEAAKTDPYLYLRYAQENTPDKGGFDYYGLNYVGTIREFTNGDSGTKYNPQFLGYTYGNDALVVNLNGGLRSFGKWNVEANLFYMGHGTFDMFTIWNRVNRDWEPGDKHSPIPQTPTDNGGDAAGNYADPNYTDRNAVSHTLVFGVNGSYKILDNLSVFGQVDIISIKNYKNISGTKAADVQLTLGATYRI